MEKRPGAEDCVRYIPIKEGLVSLSGVGWSLSFGTRTIRFRLSIFFSSDIATSTFWDSQTEIAFGHGQRSLLDVDRDRFRTWNQDIGPQISDLRPQSHSVSHTTTSFKFRWQQIVNHSIRCTACLDASTSIYLCLRPTERSFGHKFGVNMNKKLLACKTTSYCNLPSSTPADDHVNLCFQYHDPRKE